MKSQSGLSSESMVDTLPHTPDFVSCMWLTLSVERRNVSLMKISEFTGNLAFGEYFPDEKVSPDLIGHWVEIVGRFDQVLYRRFIHNKFPLFPAKQVHKGRGNMRTQVQIELPKLPQASYISIWEQSYQSEGDAEPQKTELLQIPLARSLAKAI